MTDRRKFFRSKVKDGIFAILRPQFEQLGQIIDISLGGLSFGYCATGGEKEYPAECDIFMAGEGVYLERIPIKSVSEYRMGKKSLKGSLPLIRCSVQFDQLAGPQVSKVEAIIKKCALDEC